MFRLDQRHYNSELTFQCFPLIRCKALPLVNAPGTSIACTTQADFDQRIGATGANAAGNNNDQNNAGANPNDKAKGGNNNGKNGNNNNKGGNNNNGKNATATTSSAAAAASATADASKAANNAGGAAKDNGDPQKSTTLDPKVIAKGFSNNGQDQ